MEKKLYYLTNPQKSIWLTEQFGSHTNLNNVGGYLIIQDKVNFEALEMALNQYIEVNSATRIELTLVDRKSNAICKRLSPFTY